MTPFSSPLFWCLCVASVAGITFGAFLKLSWAAPRWLSE